MASKLRAQMLAYRFLIKYLKKLSSVCIALCLSNPMPILPLASLALCLSYNLPLLQVFLGDAFDKVFAGMLCLNLR